MKNRKSRGRSHRPAPQPPLQAAQRSEKHEDEVDMEHAENLAGFFNALWDQYYAQRNSTAPSTKSEELPQVETGKEVVVRSANPSFEGQHGEERVTSIANSLKVNGDVPIEKQGGEESEEMTGQAIGELQGASKLHPLVIEESDSDSELPAAIHPSSAPEGSLLHALYLQLLGAGRDGITVRELFKCLKKPAQVLNFGGDWKVQVRRHLKTNPHFREAKGYHYLVGNDQLEVQQPSNKCSSANIASTSRQHGTSENKAVLSSLHPAPAAVQTGLSVDTHEGVVQTRRKAFQKAIAALSEQAKEFEEMHQSMADMQMPASCADPTDSQLVAHRPLLTSSKKRKPSTSHEVVAHHGLPVPDGLHSTQAEFLAETEVQTGQRCVFLKDDDTGNWRCHNMAKAGHTHCDHHMSLHVQEDVKASLSPNPDIPFIAIEAGVHNGVQCSHRKKSKDGTRSSQCTRTVMEGHRLCEHHKQRKERRKARKRAAARQGKQGAASPQHNQDSGNIRGLPESHPKLVQSPLPDPLHPKSAPISTRLSQEDTLGHTEAAKSVDTPATGVPNHDDDSNGDQLQLRMPTK